MNEALRIMFYLTRTIFLAVSLTALLGFSCQSERTQSLVSDNAKDAFKAIPLNSTISQVQPMTGIVYWADEDDDLLKTAPIQLEFSHIYYDEIVSVKGQYNWQCIDDLLDKIKDRGHQAVIRFTDISGGTSQICDPGKKKKLEDTSVPAYVKKSNGYAETKKKVQGNNLFLTNWKHPELRSFVLDFFKEFATRYDKDSRIAFVQVGFGIWSEYHLDPYQPKLDVDFPDRDFQKTFIEHLNTHFKETLWMISLDAHEPKRTPFATDEKLIGIPFGIFDDSFLDKNYTRKQVRWNVFGSERWKTNPIGGEFANDVRKLKSLYTSAPYEVTFDSLSSTMHTTFMLGSPKYKDGGGWKPFDSQLVLKSGQKFGYQFKILKFGYNAVKSFVTVQNVGNAPIYYDAYVAVCNELAPTNCSTMENIKQDVKSLIRMLPNETRDFDIDRGGNNLILKIESKRLVPGQKIGYEADLKSLQ